MGAVTGLCSRNRQSETSITTTPSCNANSSILHIQRVSSYSNTAIIRQDRNPQASQTNDTTKKNSKFTKLGNNFTHKINKHSHNSTSDTKDSVTYFQNNFITYHSSDLIQPSTFVTEQPDSITEVANFSAFKDIHSNECRINCLNTNINHYITNCDHLQRIAIGLQYHHLISQNNISNDQFVKFCQETYKNLLDDHYHFIKFHNYHLDEIQKELESKYLIPQCDIINCQVMTRHYRDTEEIEDEDIDLNYSFYMNCFDRIHHQIHHITRLGLRLQTQRDTEEITKINNSNDMSEMREMILKRSKEYGLDRFKRYRNSKFNLHTSMSQISSAEKSESIKFKNIIEVGEYIRIKLYQMDISISQLPTTGDTFIDFMLNDKYEQWSNECNNLIEILKSDDYDTDSIIMDLDDLIMDDEINQKDQNSTPCNLYRLFENTMYIVHLKDHINTFQGLFFLYFMQYRNCIMDNFIDKQYLINYFILGKYLIIGKEKNKQ